MVTTRVPWCELFPWLDSTQIMRDSTRRKQHRHYRVKLPIKHCDLSTVQARLAPYGFTCVPWHWSFGDPRWRLSIEFECIKCIRQTEVVS